MLLPRVFCALIVIWVAAAFGQPRPMQVQSSPAPDFIAYQALFRNVVWIENQAAQEDAASAAALRSQIPKAVGLSSADYAALVAIAKDYAAARASYISARDAILNPVLAQQAAGGTATSAQAVQLGNLFQQYIAMIENHVAQPASKLTLAGAQALANYVHTSVAPGVTWGK